jgi:hypothetical protein
MSAPRSSYGRSGPTGGPAEQEAQPDEPTPIHDPEVLDFARWFADWWLRRGHDQLVDEPATDA